MSMMKLRQRMHSVYLDKAIAQGEDVQKIALKRLGLVCKKKIWVDDGVNSYTEFITPSLEDANDLKELLLSFKKLECDISVGKTDCDDCDQNGEGRKCTH